jgi:gliding motility associated protien GldN
MKTISNLFIGALLLTLIGVQPAKAQSISLIEKKEVYDKEHIPDRDPVPYPFVREADVMWEKVAWRMLNLREKMNHPLYFPTRPIGDRRNITQLLLDILEDPLPGRQVFAYEPLLGYEFEKPMSLEEIYSQLKVDSIPEPVFDSLTGQTVMKIVDVQINLDDVTRLMIKEKWFFDKRYSTFQVRIIGLCPIRIYPRTVRDPITNEDVPTGDISKTQLFWVYYPEIRYYLAKQEVFNPNNDAQRISFDDLFNQRRFSSYIYKISNVYDDRAVSEYNTGMDAMFEAERIKNWLFEFEHDLWEY